MARKHAVVLGAGMSGLAAARALANHFDQVTVVERDAVPLETSSESRKGVPQGNHGHGLLSSGYRVLDAYFPGMMKELVAAGVPTGDVTGDFLWYQFGGWKLRAECGLKGICVSRPFLETAVRRHLGALPNVDLLGGTDGVEPVFDALRGRVVGLRVRDRATGATRRLDADLFVDAAGRGSQSPKWLASWGFGEVPESSLRVDIGYATGQFERRPNDVRGALGGIAAGTPPTSKRAGALFGVEGSRWIVTLGGWLKDYPPIDLQGFRDFARSLPVPEIHDVVADRGPLRPITQYRYSANRRYHFEELSRIPEGYLAVGDAISSFNPIYGQGMSVASVEAEALDECLARGDRGLAKRFFAKAARIIAGPWTIATGEDLRFPEVVGPRPFGASLLHRYTVLAHHAAQKDRVVLRRLFDVVNLLAAPSAMFEPDVAWRVLIGGVR